MSGLDPIGRKEIRDVILGLRDAGKTVFMNTHILPDVEMICDRVAIIVKGRIRHQGPIEDFLPETHVATDVVVSRMAPELVSRLEDDFEIEMRGLGDRVELSLREKDLQQALRVILQYGAEIVSVTPHRHSLEEAFLSAVREEEGAQ
jgi:ABC-2 type transport system ATP-binding protein